MRRLMVLTAVFGLLAPVTAAFAQVPQTIVVDGANDFNVANLIDADGGDTETKDWCTGDPEVESPMDLGDIFLTNDTNFLYFGYDYDRDCFASPQVNLGMAIDVNNTAAGGTTDAFARKIAWNTVPYAPDFYVYGVLDGFNYEVLYQWTGSWTVVTDGSNGLGIVDDTGFQEGKLSLATLGVSAGDTVNVELWMTQDGTTKPPLDACFSDAVQTSTPGGTTFDVGANVEMLGMHQYVIQAIIDNTPPTVSQANAVYSIGLAPSLTTGDVDVLFSEPVDPVTVIPGNFSISSGGPVSGASVDGSNASLVHLTLTGTVGPSASFFDVTVTGVKDLAGNTIVNNGTDDKGSFFNKKVQFDGDMSVFLLTNSSPPDSFWVEGSLDPLTFTIGDNSLGVDQGSDLYRVEVPFSIPDPDLDGNTSALLEYKWSHNTAGFEPRPNRPHTLDSANGDCDTVSVFWNDDLPGDVTDKPIDVCFSVDASSLSPGPSDSVGVTGDQGPIAGFTAPGVLLADDGVSPDATAGDDIYSGYIRFPLGTFKTVNYKFTHGLTIECFGQDDRDVFLNDAVFDTVGGANGPLALPTYTYDRCSVTNKAIDVIFAVSTSLLDQDTVSTVTLGGDTSPLSFGAPVAMADNGAGDDAVAGDNTYTLRVTFPDSSNFNVGFKYLVNGNFECIGDPNRDVFLNDALFSTSNPIALPTVLWDVCNQDQTGVPDLPALTPPIALAQNVPNPFSSRTAISFRADTPGRAVLTIFDVTGRKVRTLLDREVSEGEYVAHWSGRDDLGRVSPPGVYFYSLRVGNKQATKRMVYLR